MSQEERQQLKEFNIDIEQGSTRGLGQSQSASNGQPQQTRAKLSGDNFQTTLLGALDDEVGLTGQLMTILSWVFVVLTFPLQFLNLVIVKEYQRLVVFRLGRLRNGGALGPGTYFIHPFIDSAQKVDLRTVSFQVEQQETLTKDSLTIKVDAVVYYRIINATASIINVSNYSWSTQQLAATTLRNVLGTKKLSDILTDREFISHQMQAILDEATEKWGVRVERLEIKDVRLPESLQRAMAAEAEAAREARAKVVAAEGEHKASESLRAASEVISSTPAALQLRYLQTLHSIAAEKNSTIIFPLPIEIFSAFCQRPAQSPAGPYQMQIAACD